MSHPSVVAPGRPVELAEGVHWIGALDPAMRRFDIILNTANGTSYNAYAVRGERGVAVIDTVKIEFADEFFARLECVCRYDEIRVIVLNHLEPDHSGALPELMRRAPNAELVLSQRAPSSEAVQARRATCRRRRCSRTTRRCSSGRRRS